ncbi:hypothetical protein [uncultured Roseobacter sp.]|uniref:hypothetical protein n=1 Tax=uncultured Roseobacter sp. TaxID=114847 RepID=UPI002604C247|nr:hypothetical protein [uncultured Roseobacter sp.]
MSEPSIFDWLRLAISVATPLAVVAVGFHLNRRLKSIDNAQWQNRKITEKRIEHYDLLAPDLNKVFCFWTFLGYWKDIPPADILDAKRNLDRNVNIYTHLLGPKFYKAYQRYIHMAFQTFSGWGQDAKIRAAISSGRGNRQKHANYAWEEKFDKMFSTENLEDEQNFREAYYCCMNELRDCIGLDNEREADASFSTQVKLMLGVVPASRARKK